MSLKGRSDLIPIALVTIDEWEMIRRYCKNSEVTRGGDYDCPYGGAINVWLQKNWSNPSGELHGTYYPDCSETSPGLINVYWNTGAFLNDNMERPWESGAIEYDWDRNWNAYMGRAHFIKIFREVIGKEYRVNSAAIWDYGQK